MSRFLLPLFIVMCAFVGLAIKVNTSFFDGADIEVAKVDTESAPGFRPEAPGPKAAVLKKASDNHFWADANIKNTRIRFMVDTGATSVALTREDALRLGYKDEDLEYKYKVGTAGGETRGAFVMIDEIRIGSVTVKDVGALVIESDLQQSLLGMSFLGELKSYEVRQSSMIIRQ